MCSLDGKIGILKIFRCKYTYLGDEMLCVGVFNDFMLLLVINGIFESQNHHL